MAWRTFLIMIFNAKLFRHLATTPPAEPYRIVLDNYKALGDNYGVVGTITQSLCWPAMWRHMRLHKWSQANL